MIFLVISVNGYMFVSSNLSIKNFLLKRKHEKLSESMNLWSIIINYVWWMYRFLILLTKRNNEKKKDDDNECEKIIRIKTKIKKNKKKVEVEDCKYF